jgi:hypothetical protein
MSEYQYHEWQTVDRVLTPEEQAEVDSLSSHIEVSSSRAVASNFPSRLPAFLPTSRA